MAGNGKIENLRPPWKPGESGNANGRPKTKPVTEAYKARLSEKLPAALRCIKINRQSIELGPDATFLDLMTLGQCIEASKGNTIAAREIADRVEGKVPKPVEVSGPDGGNLSILEALRRRRAERLPGDK